MNSGVPLDLDFSACDALGGILPLKSDRTDVLLFLLTEDSLP